MLGSKLEYGTKIMIIPHIFEHTTYCFSNYTDIRIKLSVFFPCLSYFPYLCTHKIKVSHYGSERFLAGKRLRG